QTRTTLKINNELIDVANDPKTRGVIPTGKTSAHPAPKTAKQLAAKRNQERVKSILLLAIPDEYLLKFHNVAYAKSLWKEIKSRFGGNEESKKMQKNNQIALIMRNKPDIDEIDIDDLYNNLRVYEDEMKRSLGSNFASQNLAFLSSENTSSTNEVSTASGDFGVNIAGGISQVSSTPSGRNQGKRSYDDNGKSNVPINESSSQALVAQDGLGGYDWSNDFKIKLINYALMAISSSSSLSSSDNECKEIKISNLNTELEKVVKERDELKLKIEKCKESSKNLDALLNSQMSARDKTGLGYGTQLNEMSNNFETDSEISLSIFYVRSSDEESTPANDRSSKADGYHVVPPFITRNFLTPRADISFAGLDEYAIRKKIIKSKTTNLNTKTSETIG
ncbi:hypothetical protein Tco_1321859, partial [Tanacetum coccineum]